MWNNITRSFLPQNDDVIIKVDPNWGFSEFPSPGDSKKHLLPILIDPEYVAAPKAEATKKEEVAEAPQNKFWMPDRFCKVCYGCEEAFTMYRRRHHCRMCGQIFCNSCSSFYIDGKLFSTPGLVRACKLCYDQQYERGDVEYKATRPKALPAADQGLMITDVQPKPVAISTAPIASWIQSGHCKLQDSPEAAALRSANLQSRASAHLSAIVDRLLASASKKISINAAWKELVVSLVKEVVSSVDPDVRAGRDNMDIRPYVKIKVIPGGSIDESVYVDGVVFRKNVSHKKMGANASRTHPRILLISEGIEFQRADLKLASMDTLIEQEDKHMEIAVEKIMSLKPDIILVGKAIGRKAQELLCGHNVVVMQNVKAQLLERIGRMTGAMLLPSTDHMIKQFGEECLGTCAHFRLSVVHDDPEKKVANQPRRILETRIARGSTYAYVQGCPSDRGCSIILRGADRPTLKEIKRILAFSVIVAYHLRLEVAYYMDRYASLPPAYDEVAYDDGSDVDDGAVDMPYNPTADGSDETADQLGIVPAIKSRRERQLLSTSLDVDISLPFSRELVGTDLFLHAKSMRNKTSVDSHQTLLVTSLLVGEGAAGTPAQKTAADVKGIKYYTKQDIALGQFIIENCFQLTRSVNRESTMLDQTLSFIHRPGRVDITVRRNESAASGPNAAIDDHGHLFSKDKDPRALPIYMSSYCKVCRKMVTPPKLMSDETWKMSFGKFLEIQYYNRSARCNIGDCAHRIRDDHLLYVQCENYVADFNFIPIHAYALNVRNTMTFPMDYHTRNSVDLLKTLPTKHAVLIEDFRLAIGVLEREIKELMASRPEDLGLAMADVAMMETELHSCSARFLEDIICTLEHVPQAYRSYDADFMAGLAERLQALKSNSKLSDIQKMAMEVAKLDMNAAAPQSAAVTQLEDGAESERVPAAADLAISTAEYGDVQSAPLSPKLVSVAMSSSFSPEIGLHFPFSHLRDTYIYAAHWNNRMNNIYKFLESVSRIVMQQQQQAAAHAPTMFPTIHAIADAAEAEHYEEDYQDSKKLISEHLKDSSLGAVAVTIPPPPPLGATPFTDSPASNPNACSPSRDTFLGDHSPSIGNLAMANSSATALPAAPVVATAPAVVNATVVSSAKTKPSERPMDKMSRFTKVIQRFLVLGNKEAVAEQNTKFFVPLEEFGHGRFGLKPGRRGEVIPVYEDEYATIIAYSLASEEYFVSLQEHLQEGGSDFQTVNYSQNATSAGIADEDDKRKNPTEMMDDHDEMDDAVPLKETDASSSTLNTLTDSNTNAKHTSGIAQSLLSGLNKHRPRLDRRGSVQTGGSSDKLDAENGADLEDTEPAVSRPIISMDRAFANAAAEETEHNFSAFSTGNTLFSSQNEGASSKADQKKAAPQAAEDETAHTRNRSDQTNVRSQNEKQMISQDKSYIRHRFDDIDDKGNVICKFQCQTYWAKQFEAVRLCYFKDDDRECYIRSLATSQAWAALGGKSGASFSKSSDERFVIKCISRVELQMFLEFAPAYFEYMAKAYYHSLPTVLCKILGVYTIRYDNRETGKKAIENVVVMENIFYQRNITRTFDLKGSSRARYVDLGYKVETFDEALTRRRLARRVGGEFPPAPERVGQVLLDDNLMELTKGRPFPLKHRAKLFFHKAVQNDTLFLSIVNVVDYSILVGFDENTHEVVVGIIDYMRQYDIIKKMERMGKSVGMIAGQAEPTIIQPSQYRKRFSLAMERYFMTIPDKWITHES